MNRDYRWLVLLGDGIYHNFNEILWERWVIENKRIKLALLFKDFKKLLEYNLISKKTNKLPYNRDEYRLTNKGDEFLREMSIYYGGDYSYYKNFQKRRIQK